MDRAREPDHDAAQDRPRRAEPETPERVDTLATQTAGPAGAEGSIILSEALGDDPRRVDRAAFLTRLRGIANTTAADMLGERWTAEGCPYIDAWFQRHADTDAETLERMARRYGGLAGATTADELLEAIRLRMRMGIAYWRAGEDLTGELELGGLHATATAVAEDAALGGAIAGDAVQAQRVAAELGDGAPLAGVPGAITSALGDSFSDVRIHADAHAAQLAERAEAHAFTIGRDIVYAASAPRPGTLAGDALLAHELAHVQQQRGAPAGGRADAADADHDADLAAAETVAHRTGPSARALLEGTRRAIKTPLSLQRCPKKKEGEKDAGVEKVGDAGAPADAATLDAAVPPGKRSWVGSTKKLGPKTGKEKISADLPTMNAIADEYFDAEYLWVFIKSFNPGVDEKALGPGKELQVPTSIEVPTPAEELPDDFSQSSSVAHETWRVEGSARDDTASFKPNVPSDSSGVTLGRGYDMGARLRDDIETELVTAGIDSALAKKYRGAGKANLKSKPMRGDDARAWITKNKPFDAITAEQEMKLFRLEYRQVTDETARWLAETTTKDPTRGYEKVGTDLRMRVNLSAMNPVILAFLVDLKFRGDLNKTSWAYIQEAVLANDLEKLRTLVQDAKKHQQKFYNNFNRYESRCLLVGAVPISEVDWKKL